MTTGKAARTTMAIIATVVATASLTSAAWYLATAGPTEEFESAHDQQASQFTDQNAIEHPATIATDPLATDPLATTRHRSAVDAEDEIIMTWLRAGQIADTSGSGLLLWLRLADQRSLRLMAAASAELDEDRIHRIIENDAGFWSMVPMETIPGSMLKLTIERYNRSGDCLMSSTDFRGQHSATVVIHELCTEIEQRFAVATSGSP